MKLLNRFAFLVLLTGSWATSCLAVEFKNIGAAPVIMYDAPSVRGQKLYIAPTTLHPQLQTPNKSEAVANNLITSAKHFRETSTTSSKPKPEIFT